MSALVYGAPCEPGGQPILPGFPDMVTPEPTHVGCPGGWHLPGLLGGWTCPCDCHLRPTVKAAP